MVEQSTSPQEDLTPDGGWQVASLARRFGALLIDWILCLFVARLFADPRSVGWPPVVVLVLEYTIFVGFWGQTVGMFITRIRCVSVTTVRPVGPARALLRGLLLALLIPALILNHERRGLHDRAAGTVVLAIPPRT